MPAQFWSAPVDPLQAAAGTAYVSSASIIDASPGAATSPVVLPGKTLQLGTVLRVRAMWTASNTGTPTLLAGVYYGAVAGTALAATSAITTTTAMSGWTWMLEYEGTVQTLGTSGKIMGNGKIYVPTSLTAWTIRPLPETTPAQVTIDTTIAKAITLGLTWGTSSASNTATVQTFSVETLG